MGQVHNAEFNSRFSIPRYGLLPNTPVNNAEFNLAEFFHKLLSKVSTKIDGFCLFGSIHTTLCDELKGHSLPLPLNKDQPCYH